MEGKLRAKADAPAAGAIPWLLLTARGDAPPAARPRGLDPADQYRGRFWRRRPDATAPKTARSPACPTPPTTSSMRGRDCPQSDWKETPWVGAPAN